MLAQRFYENIDTIAFRLSLDKDNTGVEQLTWTGYENGEQVVFRTEPYTGFWRRFTTGFLRLMPIKSQI